MIKKLKSCEKNTTAVRNTITIIINFFKSLQSNHYNHYSAVMLRLLLLIFVIFCIKKPFISSDSVCYSFDFGLIDDVPVMYVYESLFQLQTSKILSLKPKLALQLLLLLSGDIELCPGPERSIWY